MESWFGAALRRHRCLAGLTQEALAERARLSVEAISALERGTRRYPRRETVNLLATALNLADNERTEFATVAVRGRYQPVIGNRGCYPPCVYPLRSRQLPPTISDFVGRDAEFKSLTSLLADAPRSRIPIISQITGMTGIGKTALAVHVGQSVADTFPDGQFYLNLRGFDSDEPMLPSEALVLLLRALGDCSGHVPINVDEATSRYRSAIAGRQVLILLDNVDCSERIVPLLPNAGGCAVLVTSQRALPQVPGAHSKRLAPLANVEAIDLLKSIIGPERIEAERPAAAEVARRCGHLPLAIRIAGTRLAVRTRWPISHLANRLSDAQSCVNALEYGGVSVRARLAASIRRLQTSSDELDVRAAAAFAHLGTFPGHNISARTAADCIGTSENEAERQLERLVDVNLLDVVDTANYRLNDLFRIIARGCGGVPIGHLLV